MAQIRLIATDMDGTFIDGMECIEKNVQAVRRAQQAGIMVLPCTGRPWGMAHYLAERGGMQPEMLVINNGSGVAKRATGEMQMKRNFPPEGVRKIAGIGKRSGIHVALHSYNSLAKVRSDISEREQMFFEMNRKRPREAQHAMHFYETWEEMLEDFSEEVQQVALEIPPEAYPEIRARLLQEMPGYEVTSSFPGRVEILAPGVNKATGLKWVAEHYGILPEEIMAVGNEKNDRCMIEYAGIGVAVRDSDPELLEAADVIVSNHQEAGFAEAVERYALRGR